MYDLIFAPSWYFLAGALLVGLGVTGYALIRGIPAQRKVGLAILLVAVLWIVADVLVTTPAEAATKGTKRFVAAVVARDKDAIRSLLSPSVALVSLGRDDIATLVPKYADDWGLKSALITDTQTEEASGEVTASIHVFSSHESQKIPDTIPSDWQFIWAKEGDEWHIVKITPIKVGTADLQNIKDGYFGARRK